MIVPGFAPDLKSFRACTTRWASRPDRLGMQPRLLPPGPWQDMQVAAMVRVWTSTAPALPHRQRPVAAASRRMVRLLKAVCSGRTETRAGRGAPPAKAFIARFSAACAECERPILAGLAFLRINVGIQACARPAAEVFQRDPAERVDPARMLVERGEVAEGLAAGFEKGGAAFHRQFFQGFQAVGGEAGGDDVDAAHALPAELRQGLVGVGLQPFGAAETRLE